MHARENCQMLIAVKLHIPWVSTDYEIIAANLCDIMKNSFVFQFKICMRLRLLLQWSRNKYRARK